MNMPLVDFTVIIVSYNTVEMTLNCLRNVEASEGPVTKQVMVIDNASADGSAERIAREFPSVRLIANAENVGFARANNQAITEGIGRYVLLLNSDAFVPPDALRKTIAFMDAHPECGISGGRIVDEHGRLQPSARFWPTPLNTFLSRTGLGRVFPWVRPIDDMSWDHRSVRACDWVPGCYFVVRGEVIDKVGLFDPHYFLYFEEVDLCMAAKRAGWAVLFDPDVEIIHIGGASAKNLGDLNEAGRQIEDIRLESEFMFYRKNYGFRCALAGLGLTWFADLLLMAKGVLKPTRSASVSARFRHIRQTWTAFHTTKFGTRSVR